ncbi:hypothetical protein V2J09_008465 [Rumex salicifolius]
MSNLKLGVEVISAHNLLQKDSHGSVNLLVELHFDGQRFSTTTKDKDLNPVWHETFYFNITNPDSLSNLSLDAYIYSLNKDTQAKSFLGKVHVMATSFVPQSDSIEWPYPLEKRSIFSRVKGDLTLKVFITNDHDDDLLNPLTDRYVADLEKKERSWLTRDTFHHLPNKNQQPVRQFFAGGAKPDAPKGGGGGGSGGGSGGDYSIKETNPVLGAGKVVNGRIIYSGAPPIGNFDLVEKMQFLYVRVVKARELPIMDITGSLDPYVEVRIGNYKGKTRHFEQKSNPEWRDLFAFARDRMQSSSIEVFVKNKDMVKDDFVGLVKFGLSEIPTRVPPDSPLAPQWYRLEDKKGEKLRKAELMLAVWLGTQADEAFSEAQHADSITPDVVSYSPVHTRPKIYHSPRLWYLRVNVVEAQDLLPSDKEHVLEVYVKVHVGNQIHKTKAVQGKTGNALWNEDLMFVVAEPFEEQLVLSVEDKVGPGKEETIAKLVLMLPSVRRRPDDKNVSATWYMLQRPSLDDFTKVKKDRFSSRMQLRVSLDGGYHVIDESTYYSSDLRPSMKQLWKSGVGLLEVGILEATGLNTMKKRDDRGTADTFCVAKYAQKWVRTRTVLDNLNPKFNEQYTWEVFDPCTVFSVSVFDNGLIGGSGKDTKIGKVRIRISTLESSRVYTLNYPLIVLNPSGVKKMGQLHLAIRFTCTSFVNLMHLYAKPLLPKMHYSRPLSVIQTNALRQYAINVLVARLARAEPPLSKEVVEYMCDTEAHLWSMRRSKANFYRVVSVLQGLIGLTKWFGEVCAWKNPVTTALVHVLYVMLVFFPGLILPTVFLYVFLIGLWNYRYRVKQPLHMDVRLSGVEAAAGDDLDEEFDTFPTSKSSDTVRKRYDRLRSVGSRIQAVMGDLAAQGERIQALMSWRDPRATSLFLGFCLCAALVLYTVPFQLLAVMAGFYVMRHPKFRGKLPSPPLNLFRRLPAKTDCML